MREVEGVCGTNHGPGHSLIRGNYTVLQAGLTSMELGDVKESQLKVDRSRNDEFTCVSRIHEDPLCNDSLSLYHE